MGLTSPAGRGWRWAPAPVTSTLPSSSSCTTTWVTAWTKINQVLTRESGLLGMTEASSDCRYVTGNYATDAGAKRALDVFTYRVAKYVGAYAAAMDGRLDALVFTGGIGENAAMVREMVLARLAPVRLQDR